LFQPPGFDWDKLNEEPARFNCGDKGLQLLLNPVLVENISFANIAWCETKARDYVFTVDGERVKDNAFTILNKLKRNCLGNTEVERVALATGSISSTET